MSFESFGSRLALAWRVLRGEIPEVLAQSSKQGASAEPSRKTPSMSPAGWARAASEWNRLAVDGSVDSKLSSKLLDEFERMGVREKAEVAASEKQRLFGFSKALFSAAKSSLDKPSESMAWELTGQHVRWLALSGELVSSESYESAATSVCRSSWWEAASQWCGALAKLAESQSEKPGDEACFSMVGTAHFVASKSLLAADASVSCDERLAAAWSACCEYPWPDRIVASETVVWAGRKWQESSYSRANPLESMGDTSDSTWTDLLVARIESDLLSKAAGLSASHDSWGDMKQRLSSTVERRKIDAASSPARMISTPTGRL